MKQGIRIVVNVMWVVIGIILIFLAFAGKVDEFWNGMGVGLFTVGIIHLLRIHRFNKNPAYRERIEIEENDERTHFIRNKAWAWTGYIFIMVAAVACIVLKIFGQDMLSIVASGVTCFMVVLYWITYVILKRKY